MKAEFEAILHYDDTVGQTCYLAPLVSDIFFNTGPQTGK